MTETTHNAAAQSAAPPSADRYHRQTLLPQIGEAGQARLGSAHVLIAGCGALGSVLADSLGRAGVGTLSLIDRDVVELTNLQRQVLFDEDDVHSGVPKAEAARARLGRINSDITVHAYVDDLSHRNARRFMDGVDLIVDGLDNFETRYLLNDLAVSYHVPYVYGGVVGTSGMSMPVLPHPKHGQERPDAKIRWTTEQATGCLRCVFPEAPPPGTSPTCDTAGVLGASVMMVAAHQAMQAIKIIVGDIDAVDRTLMSMDAWDNQVRRFDIGSARQDKCPCCGEGNFEHLRGDGTSSALSLCGRNAVQVTAADHCGAAGLDLGVMAERLAEHGQFTNNSYLLRGTFAREFSPQGVPIELTLFSNGRAIIFGTTELDVARTIYARYIGS